MLNIEFNFYRNHNDYQHFTINHSLNFKDPETGVDTNKVESMWRTAKRTCPEYNRQEDHFLGYLALFILRQKWKDEDDSFVKFMTAAANLYCGKDDLIKLPEIDLPDIRDYDNDSF